MNIIDKEVHILIGNDSLTQLNAIIASEYNDVKKFILVDENTLQHCLPAISEYVPTLKDAEIIEIESGEASKNMELVAQLCQTLIELDADRKSLLINLGGGVITDLGGFVGSIFKRGIDFINIPTTILSQVDASVGGKVGVDLGELKNQIGVFNNAKYVVVAPMFLSTLIELELLSGYAEMLKHGLINNKQHWNNLMTINFDDNDAMTKLLYESIMVKYNIVSNDFKEKGERKKLNFGHTIGHAVESLLIQQKQNVLHGEAVAMGLLCEAYISFKSELLAKNELEKITKVVTHIYDKLNIEPSSYNQLLLLMKTDKKNEDGKINFTLLEAIGKSSINHYPEVDLITASLDFYNEQYEQYLEAGGKN